MTRVVDFAPQDDARGRSLELSEGPTDIPGYDQ